MERSIPIGLGAILSVILCFGVLKSVGLVACSWWWVTAPVWSGVLMLLSVASIVGFVALIILNSASK